MSTRKRWTQTEDELLEEMYKSGASVCEIAEALGRTGSSVCFRKYTLLERKRNYEIFSDNGGAACDSRYGCTLDGGKNKRKG